MNANRTILSLLLAICLAASAPIGASAATDDPPGFDNALVAFDDGDFETAYFEFKRLAEEGHAKSQFNLGLMYFRGLFVGPNLAIARSWALKSANQGYTLAQYTIGAMYSSGEGFDKSDDEAARWFHRAAEQGHPQAQHDLATMYGEGRGVGRDAVLAYMWYSLAINGLPKEIGDYAEENLQVLKDRMNPEEIALAEELIRDWGN